MTDGGSPPTLGTVSVWIVQGLDLRSGEVVP